MLSVVGSSQRVNSQNDVALVEVSSIKTDSVADEPHKLIRVPSPSEDTINPIDMLPPLCRSVVSDKLTAHIRRILNDERE